MARAARLLVYHKEGARGPSGSVGGRHVVSMGKRGLGARDRDRHSGSAFVPVRTAEHPSS